MKNKIIYMCLMLIIFLSLGMINTEVNAGMLSKIAKGVIIKKGLNVVVKQSVKTQTKSMATAAKKGFKKVIQKDGKDSTQPLLNGELKVGKYGELKNFPAKGVDYHHIPSAKQMEKYGVNKNDGIAIGMEKSRHGLTRTYKGSNRAVLKANEQPREALGRDIKDIKKIYEDNGKYNPEVRKNLQEIIKQQKSQLPDLYKKP